MCCIPVQYLTATQMAVTVIFIRRGQPVRECLLCDVPVPVEEMPGLPSPAVALPYPVLPRVISRLLTNPVRVYRLYHQLVPVVIVLCPALAGYIKGRVDPSAVIIQHEHLFKPKIFLFVLVQCYY